MVPPYVKQLNFQDNDLIDLDGNICEDFTWLEELLADQNSVTTISRSAFSNCRALTKLTLANNQIRLLESGQFSGLTKLETLDLRYLESNLICYYFIYLVEI